MGIVSLFADITHEGARSLIGPYLGLLGASATAVGIISGLGEFIGYGLRLLTGYLSDKTRRYWLFTFLGYGMDLFAVPLLALAGRWEIAAMLIIMERTGKAIRKPSKDTLMSYAARNVGSGKGFAIAEVLDQIGAVSGPVILSLILLFKSGDELANYRFAFAILLIPALITLILLLISRLNFPQPEKFEVKEEMINFEGISKSYWLYLVAISLIAAGFADFPLLAFHFQRIDIFSPTMIPFMYAIAMGVDAVSALIFGLFYDKVGVTSLIIASSLSIFFSPFSFLSNSSLVVILGVILWGIGMGAQESILKSVVADIVTPEKRGTAYGFFNAIFGFFWFIGSAIMGVLYDHTIVSLVIFSMIVESAAVFTLFLLKSKLGNAVN
ncbi:MFS transporter [Petrotoga mexicana DSM 14811]|jgi:MFS family permease|uniref:MFS transporter n=1 Tax=Petrotoga mexicana DSM 14811 TaxID=1122954 RepID=A0A2K1PDF5_9BACT|nr:MFS transporter [Petrotoga mexicana]PNS00810.1 MFS transporter [Petrotoga mexicana DSM 14811]